jgi:hypothetical protein
VNYPRADDRAAAVAAPLDPLPIHFFTIVLNGQPFITAHLEVFRQLHAEWHWHVVEGVARLAHDTAWSLRRGGHIDEATHDRGLSVDGTTGYLDHIAAAEPRRITLYRKPPGEFWDGKREMVSAPLHHIDRPCLLWQVDADELWRAEQITAVRRLFLEQPQRSAAFFWCDYFVGPEAVVATRYNYAQDPRYEWLRVWRYQPGDRWRAHEPPTLVRTAEGGTVVDVADLAPFGHDEMEDFGAVFQHYAYATEAQVRHKESYYGQAGALAQWRLLQTALGRSRRLRDYFPWVEDDVLVDTVSRAGVIPLVRPGPPGSVGHFAIATGQPSRGGEQSEQRTFLFDGAVFQEGGAEGEFWQAVLEQWLASGFAERIIVGERAGTAPRLPGLRYRALPAHRAEEAGQDALRLERVARRAAVEAVLTAVPTAAVETSLIALVTAPERWLPASPAELAAAELCLAQASAVWVAGATIRDALLVRFPMLDPGRFSLFEETRDAAALAAGLTARLGAHRPLPPPPPSWALLRRLQDRLQQPSAAARPSALTFEVERLRTALADLQRSPFWRLRGAALRLFGRTP